MMTDRGLGIVKNPGIRLLTRRFEQLHRGAIRFPADRFHYIGIDDDGDTTEHYAGEVS